MPSKRVLVLGATGGTGQQVVAQAIQLGHTVTALVRDPRRVTLVSDHIRVLTGKITDDTALAVAMRDQDVVISTLGVGKSFKSHGLISQSVTGIVRAMRDHGVRRLIFTSAFGVGDTFGDLPLIPRIFARTLLRDVYRDKAAGEATLRASNLDWTVVYPAGLSDRPATGRYRTGEHLALRGFPMIARADVAAFLLSQVEDTSYLRKGVLISW
jgi:putative NADH-flavin reductase